MKPSDILAAEMTRKCVVQYDRIFSMPRAGQKMSNTELARHMIKEECCLVEFIELARAAKQALSEIDIPLNAGDAKLFDALQNLSAKVPGL